MSTKKLTRINRALLEVPEPWSMDWQTTPPTGVLVVRDELVLVAHEPERGYFTTDAE